MIPLHGTIGTYTRAKCRCRPCRAAWAEYQRRWRARRNNGADRRSWGLRADHGTRSRYTAGCRCEPCRAENNRYGRELAARHRPTVDRRRLPLAPLEEWFQLGSTKAVARFFGVWPRQVYRWRENGIPAPLADELVVRAGVHPAEVWPEWAT